MPVYQNKETKKWKFRVYTDDVYGNRKQFERKWFNTKKEAIQAERDFLLQDKNEIANMTFNDLWIKYKDYKELQLKSQSLRSVVSRFDNHILPYFKDKRICDINTSNIIKWQNEIQKLKTKHGKPYAPTYLRSINSQLSSIFNHAVRYYNLRDNPVARF